MLYYRLYFLLPDTAQIQHFTAFIAPDDAAAVAMSEEHQDADPLELWCQDRLVRRFGKPGEPLAASLRAAAE